MFRTSLPHRFLLSFLVLALVALGPTAALAEDAAADAATASEAPAYDAQIDQFFVKLESGEYAEAIAKLYGGNPWMESQQANLETLKTQFADLKEALGELHGHELLSEQWISDRYVYRWYLVRFDRSPVSFYFKFYKPADEWRFYSFEYKEDLSQVARDMALREMYREQIQDSAEGSGSD